jgi:D-beta-D-heptose 7-phosphate kinase/D-beta-D-heptose 1-phosphate adenosyltransferase
MMERRVSTAAEAGAFASGIRQRGGIVVFTNGVFDLLHPGHLRYLREARALGDALIVAINTDRSVRANKGAGRPINPQDERAELLLALDAVDAVTMFDEDTPHAIITAVQPDVLVKGADWGENNIVGRDVVEARGGRVVRMEPAPGFSTTALLDRVRALRWPCGTIGVSAPTRNTRVGGPYVPLNGNRNIAHASRASQPGIRPRPSR